MSTPLRHETHWKKGKIWAKVSIKDALPWSEAVGCEYLLAVGNRCYYVCIECKECHELIPIPDGFSFKHLDVALDGDSEIASRHSQYPLKKPTIK